MCTYITVTDTLRRPRVAGWFNVRVSDSVETELTMKRAGPWSLTWSENTKRARIVIRLRLKRLAAHACV